jgi:hypothetical protein
MVSYYRQCLKSGRKRGAANAERDELLAMVLESTAQLMLGAVSPELIFKGCLAEGIFAREVTDLMCTAPERVEALQWV